MMSHEQGAVVATANTRMLIGNLVFWGLVAAVIDAVGYALAFGDEGGFGWALVIWAIACAVVVSRIDWNLAPNWSLIIVGWLATGSTIVGAFNWNEPGTLLLMLPIGVCLTTFYWQQRALVAVHLVALIGMFVGFSYLLAGATELHRALIVAPIFVLASTTIGFLANRLSQEHLSTQRLRGTTTALLAALQSQDGYSADHSAQTRDLAVSVARRLHLSDSICDRVGDTAELHDIGKIGVPSEILEKPGVLTSAEWDAIKEHPATGARIVSQVPGFERLSHALRHEHEHWDGSGYPDGLSGEQIPIESRIVLACDAFIAMTSDRPYRPAYSLSEACDELRRCAGTQFDPRIVAGLITELSQRHPVRLKQRGTVTRIDAARNAKTAESRPIEGIDDSIQSKVGI